MFKSAITETVITEVKRLPNSVNGNPKYKLTLISGHVVRTAPDTQLGYDFGYEDRLLNVPVFLTFNADGNVIGVALLDGALDG